jgi:hypothetical protein
MDEVIMLCGSGEIDDDTLVFVEGVRASLAAQQLVCSLSLPPSLSLSLPAPIPDPSFRVPTRLIALRGALNNEPC